MSGGRVILYCYVATEKNHTVYNFYTTFHSNKKFQQVSWKTGDNCILYAPKKIEYLRKDIMLRDKRSIFYFHLGNIDKWELRRCLFVTLSLSGIDESVYINFSLPRLFCWFSSCFVPHHFMTYPRWRPRQYLYWRLRQ